MAKTLAIVFGVVFVLVGILGFIDNPLVGEGALFHTNTMHDLVHLLFGVILLAVAFRAPGKSAKWLKILGIAYLVLAVLGFFMIPDGGTLLGVAEMNHADHWLHVVLGVVLVGSGVWAGKGSRPAPAGPAM